MIAPTTALAMGFAKTLNRPLSELYIFLKENAKFHLDKKRLNEINEKLEQKINHIRNVKTIYKGDEAINLESFFFAPNIAISKEQIKKINKIDEFGEKNIVLEGVAGQGKSILMRYLVCQEFLNNNRIPIFIELRKINKEGDIIQYIKESLNVWLFSISDALLDWCLSSGKIALFLDGFDELREEDTLNFIKDIEYISQKYIKTKIIISSRPENSIQASSFFKVVRIQPYTLNEQIGLIRILIEEKESFETVVKAIKDNPLDIKELLSTPLMVTLFVMTYRAKLIIPDSLSKFYQDLFSVLIYKHDRTKPGYQREFKCSLNESLLQEWFEVFCFISKNQKKLSFESRNELLEYINKSIEKVFQDQDSSHLLDDISKNLCLIIKDGNNYNFIHRSIQEFFAASFIKNRPENLAEKAYQIISQKAYQYRAEINFLSEIDQYRYYRFLLIPTLENFFSIYKNEEAFINSLYVRAETDESLTKVEVEEILYSNSLCLFFKNGRKNNSYLELYLNDLLIDDSDFDWITSIMTLGGFSTFAPKYFLTTQKVKNDKVSKFFRNNRKEVHTEIYRQIFNTLKSAKNLVEERDDQSFLELI